MFIEREVILAAGIPDERGRGTRESFVPGVEALGLLADHHRVIVLGGAPVPAVPGAPDLDLETAASLPSLAPAASWLVTADPAICAGERPAGVRTILVGPRRPPDRRPTARCDIEARDLSTAIMEILVRDAMR